MSIDPMESLGKAVQAARIALDWTQEDAAERIGISVPFYGRIERGHSLPSIQVLARMVQVLGISANVLTHDPDRVSAASRSRVPHHGPKLRRLVRQLRKASPKTIRVVTKVVDALRIPPDEPDEEE